MKYNMPLKKVDKEEKKTLLCLFRPPSSELHKNASFYPQNASIRSIGPIKKRERKEREEEKRKMRRKKEKEEKEKKKTSIFTFRSEEIAFLTRFFFEPHLRLNEERRKKNERRANERRG